jgi:hypothetical protein
VIYAAYLGVAVESAIIDIDHWRHYFLILGALWALMVASRPYLVDRRAGLGQNVRHSESWPGLSRPPTS